MRGKVAKALRRQARAATEGAPEAAYLSRQHVKEKLVPVINKITGLPEFEKGKFGARGKPLLQKARIITEEVRLDPNSTKGHYRQLKRQYKQG